MIRHTLALAVLLATSPVLASDSVTGDAVTFKSPNGIVERCIRITPIPGGNYSDGDRKQESAYCEIDLYASDVALCPKTWSTSPGMMVYDISSGAYAGKRDAFMRKACREGKSADRLATDKLAKYKTTMNAKATSGTYAPSSLLYYHFSRYFDMTVKVPVAVWRSMDAQAHLSEVAESGLVLSGGSHGGRMNHAGWQAFVNADRNPSSYSPTDDLFTSDRKQIYGVLLSSPGHRYGSEINGTRKSGWGKGQNRDFQETPAYLALRSDKPLEEAIREGVTKGRKDRRIAKDLDADVPPQQMAYWMKELTEIVLLDYIIQLRKRGMDKIDAIVQDPAVPTFANTIEAMDASGALMSKARHVFVIKRSLSPGFAGIKNELFEYDNTMMLFSDAKEAVQGMVTELKELG